MSCLFFTALSQQLSVQLQRKSPFTPRIDSTESSSSSYSSITSQGVGCSRNCQEFSNHMDTISNVTRGGLANSMNSSDSAMSTGQGWTSSSSEETRSLEHGKCQKRNTVNNECLHYNSNVLYEGNVPFRIGIRNTLNDDSQNDSPRLKRRRCCSMDDYKCHSDYETPSGDSSDSNNYKNMWQNEAHQSESTEISFPCGINNCTSNRKTSGYRQTQHDPVNSQRYDTTSVKQSEGSRSHLGHQHVYYRCYSDSMLVNTNCEDRESRDHNIKQK